MKSNFMKISLNQININRFDREKIIEELNKIIEN